MKKKEIDFTEQTFSENTNTFVQGLKTQNESFKTRDGQIFLWEKFSSVNNIIFNEFNPLKEALPTFKSEQA